MISAKLVGGLGNQLFIIATTSALAWRNGDDAIFDLGGCYTPLQGNPAYRYADTILRNVKNGEFEPQAYYKEPCHTFVPISYQEGLLIDGYFQSEKYFADFEDEIKNLFVLNDFRSEVGDKIGIHCRRGDYLKNPQIFPLCGMDYYEKAMEIFGKDNKFIVVSDDIGWCQKNLVGDNIEYSELDDEVLDMAILASCKSVIGSNSTFAFWGAYLNKNKEFQAIFPKKWFGSLGPSSQDIIPDRWIQL